MYSLRFSSVLIMWLLPLSLILSVLFTLYIALPSIIFHYIYFTFTDCIVFSNINGIILMSLFLSLYSLFFFLLMLSLLFSPVPLILYYFFCLSLSFSPYFLINHYVFVTSLYIFSSLSMWSLALSLILSVFFTFSFAFPSISS